MKRPATYFLYYSIFTALTLFSFARCQAQCVTYIVDVCIDGQDKLHIKGNQMWWQHIDFDPPGQHPDCASYGVGIEVNGNNWGVWDSAYTIANVSCATLTDSTILCANICTMVQTPDSANGWETIYDFNDDALGGPHMYEHRFTFCYLDSASLTGSISAPPVACLGDSSAITFTGSTTATAVYNWNFGGGAVKSGTGAGPYLVTWPDTGIFPISVSISNGCGNSGIVYDTVYVRSRPTSAFNVPVQACAGTNELISYTGNASDSAVYNWNFGNGNVMSGTGQGPYLIDWVNGDGRGSVSLTVSENGCTSRLTSDTIIVFAVPGVTLLPPNDSICPGDSVTISAHGASNYNWVPSPGLNLLSDSSVVASPSITTTYLVIGNNGICTDTAQTVVNVGSIYNSGNITASNDTICSGEPVTLTVTGSVGPIQWQSSSGGSFANITGANDSTSLDTLLQRTSFQATAGTGNCATSSAPLQVVVNPTPEVSIFASDTLFCSSDSAKLQCTGNFATYNWNTGDTMPFIYVQDAGGYSVTVTDADGCSAVSNHQNVYVYPVSSVSIVVQGDTLYSFGAAGYQWYLNDTLIPGANNSIFVAPGAGDYSVEITDTNGCVENSSQVSIISIGAAVQDITNSTDFKIYPNPFSTDILITVSNPSVKIEQVEIYDVLGRIVFTEKTNLMTATVKLDVSALSEGVYFIRTRINGMDYSKQIVKQ